MKRAAQGLLALAFTCGLGWWAFRDVDWAGQFRGLASAQFIWLIPYFVALTIMHVVRVIRWRLVLPKGEASIMAINEALAIGYMLVVVLPFRLGELVRPVVLTRKSRVSFGTASGTVVVERIFDGVFVAVSLRVLLLTVSGNPESLQYLGWAANVVVAAFTSVLAFLLAAFWQRERTAAVIRALVRPVSVELAEKLQAFSNQFVQALRQWWSPGRFLVFLVLTATFWTLQGVTLLIMAQAFSCGGAVDPSCVPLNATFQSSLVVAAILVVGLMIPAAPGMTGTFQAAARVGLALFVGEQVLTGTGMAYANALWLFQTGHQIVLGLLVAVLSGTSLGNLLGNAKAGAEEHLPSTPT